MEEDAIIHGQVDVQIPEIGDPVYNLLQARLSKAHEEFDVADPLGKLT